MSRKGRARKTHNRAATKQTFQNTILRGVGGETLQDRSAHSSAASSLHPYFNNNFIARWREYVQLYMTSWEARKIVDIPIQDALREPVTIHGLSEIDLKKLMDGYEALNAEKQLRRALIQERLLGGALILPVLARGKDEDTDSQLSTVTILPGDLKTFNVIDISKLGRGEYEDDCFSPEYDQIKTLHINGTIVHASRLLIFDGAPLFNFSGQRVMENFRFNPVGMGESVLSTLYDTITRAIGTQQGAYHLVNLASCIVLACAELRSLSATNSPARAKLDEMAEQLSMYRAAIVDAKDVEFKQYSSNFGAVPELIMSFLQILAAGSDIPATRFLGQAPGGLNATGESDLENYYNHIASWQRTYLAPRQRRIFDFVGANIWGGLEWAQKSREIKFEYPPLWNLDKVQQSQVDNTYTMALVTMVEAGLITPEDGLAELKERKIVQPDVEMGDVLAKAAEGFESPFGSNPFSAAIEEQRAAY